MTETTAQFIGTHGVEIFLTLLVTILLATLLLWRLFEAHYARLWRWLNQLWRWFIGLPFFNWLRQKYPDVWSFLGKRLTPRGYLGLYLGLGLLISVVALNLFGELADMVVESGPLIQFDQALAVAVNENVMPLEVTLFQWVTSLGGRWATIIIGLAVGAALLYYRRWILLIGWAVAILGNSLLNAVLKDIFQRTRPELPNSFIVESNWSFPSGHAMGSVVIYGMLAYLLTLKLHRYLVRTLVVLAVALMLLIGFSRIFLGVHFFSDIVAGYIAGFGWLAVVISGTEVARRRQQRQQTPASSPAAKREATFQNN